MREFSIRIASKFAFAARRALENESVAVRDVATNYGPSQLRITTTLESDEVTAILRRELGRLVSFAVDEHLGQFKPVKTEVG